MIRLQLADDRAAERAALAAAIDHRDERAAASAIRRFEATGSDAAISIVAETAIPGLARTAARHTPDVIALVAGDTAVACREIEAVMAGDARPILVLTHGDADRAALLRAGAVDTVPADSGADAIRRRVRVLSGVPVVTRRAGRPKASTATGTVVGLVASTGGPPALARLLGQLRGLQAPILVVQHIDESFAAGFAEWLGRAAGVPCRVAADGERTAPGRVYLAPPGRHLRLGAGSRLELGVTPRTLHMPSGDELLTSVAAHAGHRAVGAILTGMGADGARGLRAIRDARGHTFVQDEASSAVWGMPRAAAAIDPAARAATPERIGRAIVGLAGLARATTSTASAGTVAP